MSDLIAASTSVDLAAPVPAGDGGAGASVLNSVAARLHDVILNRQARVGIVGLGYVGLPLACLFAERGFACVGFDVDPIKVTALVAGQSYIAHIPAHRLGPLVAARKLDATHDMARLADMDVVIVCVPTPLTRQREPDLRFVTGTAEAIAATLRPGRMIVLESSTYPGTTREVVRPILEQNGLASGTDFFLAYSPEREDPGNVSFGTAEIPKIIGGDDPSAGILAQLLYDQIVVKTVLVSSPETAELVKLTENIFRAVNIALANELKVICDAMGIDVWEVIAAAKTKPFGFMPFYPGPGLGGHCIPIDPFYLTWKAREFGINTKFIELAGEINAAMPNYVVQRLAAALSERFGKALNGARILLVGLAYKKNVDDIRESPALVIIAALRRAGASVSYHDPQVPMVRPTRAHGPLAGLRSVVLTPATINSADAVVIVTDHDAIDYGMIDRHARLVIDTRNAMAHAGFASARVVKA